MKVVLFCGGYGMRMRSDSTSAPKPMMTIGGRPVLWHVMRYYAHFGHTEFILCLGFGAEAIKDYFLNYRETASNDFVLSEGGTKIELLSTDISDWRITFVDTGLESSIGERLRRVRPYLADDEVFLANYGDVVTDAPLPDIVEQLASTSAHACFLATRPQATFHVLELDAAHRVHNVRPISEESMWVNGGFFVLRREIFDVLGKDEDLVGDALPRLAERGRLVAYPHHGFWAPMDTLKERAYLEELYRRGACPWAVWLPTAPAPDATALGHDVPPSEVVSDGLPA